MGCQPVRSLLFIFFLFPQALFGQVSASIDTTRVLDTLTVEAYASHRSPTGVAASVGVVLPYDIKRFSEVSLVPAFNMLPGVRMEERSPGSYRFSIRGSLIRSPFGIRNVKFYWNGLPYTDGGGNTYLNLIDPNSLARAEVIKGPAGSLYGAGTGGAVLMRSSGISESAMGLSAQFGSFGNVRYGGLIEATSEGLDSRIQFIHQEASGYRTQSALQRNAFTADMAFKIVSGPIVKLTMLYSDLNYQTPGGLTLAQYETDPSQARPTTPSGPGAVDQHAAVANKTLFSGVSIDQQWNKSWSTTLGFVGSTSDFRNPAIRNYEIRKEQNLGMRLSNSYEQALRTGNLKLTFGLEYQQLNSPVTVTNNLGGTPGTSVLSDDDIRSQMVLGFGQLDLDLAKGWQLTTGVSVNYVEYTDKRKAVNPPETAQRKFDPVILPRIALWKKFSKDFTAYGSVSRGYSPPTVAEVVPSTGIYNPTLNPETGYSYELGVNGKLAAVNFRIALYDFRLQDAIVLQRDSSGADFFVNAGNITQQGIEVNASWEKSFNRFVRSLRIMGSLTYSNYHFGQYVYDGNDYTGNPVTGVAPWIVILGLDVNFTRGVYFQLTGNFTDRIPLNDASTDFASHYFLLGCRAGYRTSGKLPIELYGGIDNALNQRYSLGNDLNAAGKRYYNAAPTINYYFGLSARMPFRKK